MVSYLDSEDMEFPGHRVLGFMASALLLAELSGLRV